MARPQTDTVQVTVRIPKAWFSRLDALLPTLTEPGIYATRSDAIRAATARGLDVLEADRTPPAKRRK